MWQTLAHHRTLRRLWIAATVDALGSWLLVIAVPVHVYAVTGSATSTSLALAVEALPAMLIGPWAGVAADRFSRRTVLVLANIVSAAGVALMLAATTPFIYLGLLVENLAVCFLRPAFQAAVPTVVPDEPTLASANALLALSNSTWRIGGPLLGTYLTAIGWFPVVVLMDLASYLIAAAVIGTLPIPWARPTVTRLGHQLRPGLHHVARTPSLRGLLASSWLYWTANAGLTALLVPFATERLHASGRAVGYLITGLGIGYLCGSAISRTVLLRFRARTIIAIAYATVGLCFLVLFTTTSLPVAVAAATASGLPGAAALVATTHHLQVSTPDQVRGRVSAAFHQRRDRRRRRRFARSGAHRPGRPGPGAGHSQRRRADRRRVGRDHSSIYFGRSLRPDNSAGSRLPILATPSRGCREKNRSSSPGPTSAQVLAVTARMCLSQY
ncbi:MAG TPA: MFS transporter [Candidatus Limnocylindrales bacterium]|nr:MFS transporter [Candidatus Limnocylindrales bacterium]